MTQQITCPTCTRSVSLRPGQAFCQYCGTQIRGQAPSPRGPDSPPSTDTEVPGTPTPPAPPAVEVSESASAPLRDHDTDRTVPAQTPSTPDDRLPRPSANMGASTKSMGWFDPNSPQVLAALGGALLLVIVAIAFATAGGANDDFPDGPSDYQEDVPFDEAPPPEDEIEPPAPTFNVESAYREGLSSGRTLFDYNMQYPASMQQNPATSCASSALRFRSDPNAYNAFIQGCLAGASGG